MKKLNNRGFSAVEFILIIGVVGIIGGVGWYVWDKNNKGASTNTNKDSIQNATSKESQNNYDECVGKGLAKYEYANECVMDGVTYKRDSSTQPKPSNDELKLINLDRYFSVAVEYASNHNGSLPATSNELTAAFKESEYANDTVNPTSLKPYVVVSRTPSDGEIEYAPASLCEGDELKKSDNLRAFAVRVKLEDGKISCLPPS